LFAALDHRGGSLVKGALLEPPKARMFGRVVLADSLLQPATSTIWSVL
jgi:hypothetical protein